MEEVNNEEAATSAPSQLVDQLQDAAQTHVTQAEVGLDRQSTPPRSTFSPVAPPSQLPDSLTQSPLSSTTSFSSPVTSASPSSPPSQLPNNLMGSPIPNMAPIPSMGSIDTSPSVLAPPTAGFVPGTGMIASPPKAYFSPPSSTPVSVLVPDSSAPPQASSASPNYAAALQSLTGGQGPDAGVGSIDLSSTPPQEAGPGLFGWLSGGIANKVKSAAESMITTLDPGMKEVIYSGGDVDIVVTSVKEVKVSAVRQAFQDVFGKATVAGQDSQPGIAPQPVGHTAALKGAEDRINLLRQKSLVDENQTVVSVENFIAELLPDRWFDLGCIILRDPANNIELTSFTTAIPVPAEYVLSAQDATPSDYPLRWSGLAVTVGQMVSKVNPHISHYDWHEALTGVSRQTLIYLAAKTLAGMYKQRLPGHS